MYIYIYIHIDIHIYIYICIYKSLYIYTHKVLLPTNLESYIWICLKMRCPFFPSK